MDRTGDRRTTRWGKAYGWWLLHPRIDADRFCILAALATYADDEGACHPSQATLAKHLKRSRPWVNRVIAELAEFGFITKTARTRSGNAGTTSCEYRLVPWLNEEEGVTGMTPGCHECNAPRPADDRNQPETKHKQTRCPAPRAMNDQTLVEQRLELIPVPTDWTPSATTVATAKSLSPEVDLQAHAVLFAAKSRAKGYCFQRGRMDDAWLSWLADDRLRQARRDKTPGEASEKRLAAWATAASIVPHRVGGSWS